MLASSWQLWPSEFLVSWIYNLRWIIIRSLTFKLLNPILQKTYPKLPENGFGQVQFYSFIPGENCKINFELNGTDMTVDSAFSERSYYSTAQKKYGTES